MSVFSGRFLTFEGVDGAGKSTHIEWVCEQLRQAGIDVCQTREPGGTPIGEKLRELLLHEPMHLQTETLLMFAARNEHLRSLIEPALARGQWVVCDRFTDATFAYQGGGRELGLERVAQLANWVHPGFKPDRTWLFDVPLEVARERLSRTRTLDRFEQEQDQFFIRTRTVYLDHARNEPGRFKVIDATQSIETVRLELQADLKQLIALWGKGSS
ncbi:dTMP kinase [Orrella daihaiensis]|uniref:Thymidylate kinase n=1 Tax=Orrella daihaiensis TaxID=2782176 RepID=A0ABY4AGD6_9BURK|nr:dTMP kinase [Orrella daihaiensis]UOD49352.1 dTMP kinase [Orrella daihaiensis]